MEMCIKGCKKKSKYGKYCGKHKKSYLLDSNNLIIIDNFTYCEKDYLKKELINSLNYWKNNPNSNEYYIYRSISRDNMDLNRLIKSVLFLKFTKYIKDFLYYQKNIKSIETIQFYIRKHIKYKRNKLRGPGYQNKSICKNQEDFLFMTNINDIDDTFFFSYIDDKYNVWFFDIRSFLKIIENDKRNPWTRDILPDDVIQRAINLSNNIPNLEINDYNKEFIINDIKQSTVNLFSAINLCGYDMNIDWFLKLRRSQLKNLYILLEDIWNYRAQLSDDTKHKICPPNGVLCSLPVNDINSINDKRELQRIILYDINRINKAVNIDDKRLGFIYFIIALCDVSQACYECYYWLIYES